MTYEKAVTSTQYYDEIARMLVTLGEAPGIAPAEMGNRVVEAAVRHYDNGYADGLAQGESDGRQAAYDEFWDAFQSNGTRKNYENAFGGSGWNDTTFKPKYIPIQPTIAQNMFMSSGVTEITPDVVDFSKTTNFAAFASGAKLQKLVVDMSNAIMANYALNAMGELTDLEVTFGEKLTAATHLFATMPSLTNFTMHGTFDCNNQNIGGSPNLTEASLLSIIGALKNHSGTSVTRTLKVGATNYNKLSEAQIAEATQKGWSIIAS